MKLPLLPALLLLLPLQPRESLELVYAPEEGTELRRLFEAEAEYRLTDLSASIDGEEVEHSGGLPDYSMRFREHIAVTDSLASVQGGRPTELVRVFDELRQENVDQMGEEESETELSSPLEGRSVRFRWDEDEEAYAAETADEEDDEIDSSLLEALLEDMDLRLVLPGDEVEVGDEWELDPRLYLGFMWPGGLLDFHVEGEEPGAEERASSLQTIEHLDGSGTARLEEVREEDGLRLAVIHVELEITTGSERVIPAAGEGEFERPEITIEVEIERSLEGTVLWDLEHGHAHSAELECESSRLSTESWTISGEHEGEQISADVEQARLLEGTIRYRATIERL